MRRRLTRAAKELLGRPQWRIEVPPTPQSFEEQLYTALIRAGDICYDVGAHSGAVALFLARLAGVSGLVVAFEPVWRMYRELCAEVQADDFVKAPIVTVPLGLGDERRAATLQVPDGRFQMASLAPADTWSHAQPGCISSHRIALTTLDAFLTDSRMPRPTFLKIDTEGAEWLVLRGASALFSGGERPLMLVEVFAPWERAFGYDPWEPLSLLMSYGYRFFFQCPGGLERHRPTKEQVFPPAYVGGYNLVAYYPGRHEQRICATGRLFAPSNVLLPMEPPPIPNVIEGASPRSAHRRR